MILSDCSFFLQWVEFEGNGIWVGLIGAWDLGWVSLVFWGTLGTKH